ncbi:PREDICTED: leucine-rich repeat-containing protein 66 [Elephantulus edwardii]|uniref:leucine-rich repeat-containing protein 66 n=1 Tax=Elephantulus edwardii TaxID=28737 RepID=UPI0003F06A3F|nr:PREDICTED: leucine-rich repeat-containing protein 66 [Elephantulus edwardii]
MHCLCLCIIATVIGLSLTGTMTDTSRTSNIVFSSECQGEVYLLTNCSVTRNSAIQVNISQTLVTADTSFNFFRLFLWSNMEEEWNIKHLDLSNNVIPKITFSVLVCLRGLEILNLSNNAIHSISLEEQSHRCSWAKHPWSRHYLPSLKVLLLQRNKLSDTPKGLWNLKSLQSLDLSFNEISQIGLTDFHNCLQLENLYLKSNRIFKIHPRAFKTLKKLQIVDLSGNALTTVLPLMAIALELPHLEAVLADNQWHCDDSIAFFQNVISESWREKWSKICSKSIGNEVAFQWTPQSRILRDTHLSHIHLNHRGKLQAESSQEGVTKSLSILGNKEHVDSAASEKLRRLPRWRRDTPDAQSLDRKEDGPSQDLALAVCLSVFITFFVAFCLGALARPYIDRLWQQRCRNKSPGPKTSYSNEGFYDEIEGTGNLQLPNTSLSQAFHGLNHYEDQDALSVMPSPHTAVPHGRASGSRRKGPGSQQSTTQCENTTTGPGTRNDQQCSNDSATRPSMPNGVQLHGHPNAGQSQPIAATHDHIYRNYILREQSYETVAREDSLNPMNITPVADRFQTAAGSNRDVSNVVNSFPAREMAVPLSKVLTDTSAIQTAEKEERGNDEQLPPGAPGPPLGFSKEMGRSTQQQLPMKIHPEEEPSVYYSTVAHSDPGDTGPSSALPPKWASGLDATPAHREFLPNYIPSDTQSELETDDDSDEGSLFTMSSVSSEGTRDVSDEEAHDAEGCRASEPLDHENSRERMGNIGSLESLEDNNSFQDIPGKHENLEGHFVSSPEPGSWQKATQGGDNPGAGRRLENLLLKDSAAQAGVTLSNLDSPDLYSSASSPPSMLFSHGHPTSDGSHQILATQQHISGNDILEELNYETVAQDDVLSEHSMAESRQESPSNVNTFEDTLTLPRTPRSSPVSVEIPGMFIYDYVIDPQPEAVTWRYSLRDLEFSDVDHLSQTPPCSAEVASHPGQHPSLS